MAELDYRGARASNAGDEFHELWAVRQALALLEPATELRAITVEGVLAAPNKDATSNAWDGVDCALYFGGDTVATASRVDLVQLKYSPSDPSKSWTNARLCSTSSKKGNNSVLRRLSAAFEAARQVRGGNEAGIRVQLISNQPIDTDVVTLFAAVASNAKLSAEMNVEKEKARKATGLKAEDFRRFAAAVDWFQDVSRFAIEESVLRTISAWTEGDARPVLERLQSYVARMMKPEGHRSWITKESLFAQFGFSDSRAFFPCPVQIKPVANLIHRAASDAVVVAMQEGKQYICIHGPAGCGKTTALQEVRALLTSGSLMLVFDCYGAGHYLDADAYRHSPKDAFLELSNELAARLRVPLLLTQSDGTNYARAFHNRLARAADVLKNIAPDACLVVAVDAADNSVTAALQMTPPQPSFVHEFMNLGSLPDNVRLLVSARSARLQEINLPRHFHEIPIAGFTRNETAQHVRSVWPDAEDAWIDDFDRLSSGNPRVQHYALTLRKDEPGTALAVLLPSGKVLNELFQAQLQEAGKKAGREELLDTFAAALTVLPHPAPVLEIAAVSGLTEAAVSDICADLAPGVHVTNGEVGFADEDFEAYIRARGASLLTGMRVVVADRFLVRHPSDVYAAMHIASALYTSGRGKELLDLIESEAQPKAIKDPIVRREVGFQRLQTAMHFSAETNDQASMLKTIMVGAEAIHSSDAIFALIVKNPDLAAAFMRESATRTLLLDARQISNHGRLLFHLMFEEARMGNRIGARTTHRQLRAWLDKRAEEIKKEPKSGPRRSQDWVVSNADIAAQVGTALLLSREDDAIWTLKRWRPRTTHAVVARIVVPRLVASGQAARVEEILKKPRVSEPSSLFLLVPLALAGLDVDLNRIARALKRIRRRGWITLDRRESSENSKYPSSWLDTVVTACEILIARGDTPSDALPVLELLADAAYRVIDRLYTSDTNLLDLQLRACTLIARLEKRTLTVDTFLITPPDATDEKDLRLQRHQSDHRERLRRFIRPLIHVYQARASLIAGGLTDAERAEAMKAVGEKLYASDFTRAYESFEMRRRTAMAVASLRCVPGIAAAELLPQALGIFGDHDGRSGPDELAVLPAFLSDSALHSEILKIIAKRASRIKSARTIASEKIEALLDIARLIMTINRDEAAAYFADAHRMTEEIDAEVMHQIRAISSIALRAASALAPDKRRLACQRLHSAVTDAAIRLAYQEEFPWDVAVEAITHLDPQFALACIARWQDADTKDLTTTFSTFLFVALQKKLLSPQFAVSLLPMLGYASSDLLRTIAASIEIVPEGIRQGVSEELARDALLRFGRTRVTDVSEPLVKCLPPRHPVPAWITALRETAVFLKSNENARTPLSRGGQDDVKQRGPSVSLPPGERFISPRAISDVVLSLVSEGREKGRHLSVSDVLEQIRGAVSVADRIQHLDALAAIRSDDISEYVLADAISHALDDPEWKDMASVRAWCRAHLSDVVVDLLPGFAHGFGYGGRSPLPPILTLLASQGIDVPTLLARAVGKHVDGLSARVVYELVRLMAARMRPEDAASALLGYVERMRDRIPDRDLDEINVSEVPADFPDATARFLFALMSDCDVRIRWDAAHSMRRIAAFGLIEAFDAWVKLYDRTTETAFRAANEPFFWLSARLWSVIVLNRVAYETPEAVARHFPMLVKIAGDASLPHLLICEFAKNAALHLLETGRVRKSSAQIRKQLLRVNMPTIPRADQKQHYAKRGHPEKKRPERRFAFDLMDTVPYWYNRAIGLFADVTQEEFLDVAERWIVDRWQTPVASSRWELKSREARFSERNWLESSNDHGSEPILERFRTYLERHAMFCAIGELMQTKALAKVGEDDYDRFEVWLKEHGLSLSPSWLADLRCTKPLERQFWSEPGGLDKWLKGAADDELLAELGITKAGWITVDAWHDTRAERWSSRVRVNSALVEPAVARSLMRSLQSTHDPYAFGLPYVDTDLEITDPPYRLLGWLENVSSGSGIDELDPMRRTVSGIGTRPGIRAHAGLKLSFNREGHGLWSQSNGSVAFEHLSWSDQRNDDRSGRRQHGLESDGHRLAASVEMIHDCMVRTGMDLIISIKCYREEEGRDDYEKTDKEDRKSYTGKIILLRQNGDIETCDGRIGTWKAPRHRA